MIYRSRTDIVSTILQSASSGGTTKTKIMYNAFLSFVQLKDYLTTLIANGLLEYNAQEKIYKTTEKGMLFLKIHGQLDQLMVTTK